MSREGVGLSRRRVLAGATAALCFAALGRSRGAQAGSRWGELVTDPHGVLDLPRGFSYAILDSRGEPMSDGYRVPARPDAMACFVGPSGTLILMRNHENSIGALADGPYMAGQPFAPEAYDPSGMGGVSRVVVDAHSFARVSSNMVLMGTARNCAGGPSPWGWLSCEETVVVNGGRRHGYVFLCSIDADSVRPADPKLGLGRCFREAAAVDPRTNITYLSEDRPDSCLYRFVPAAMSEPFVGKLQALALVGQPQFATKRMTLGERVEIEWIDIDDPDPVEDTLRFEAVAKGAATIARGEGMWFTDDRVLFSATIGGPIDKGQIFELVDEVEAGRATLEVLACSEDPELLDMPDNITIAPWGELFLVEDGPGTNAIRWLDAEGQTNSFGRTSLSEITGVCFSPDGRAMFVNIQAAGLTLVITGPFVEGGEARETISEAAAGCACA